MPERDQYFRRFVEDYEAIRKAEGRGLSDAAYYRALPFEDLTLEHSASWRIRAASYRMLVKEVIGEDMARHSENARILDLGAGNCWLSNRLSAKGLDVAAIDLSINIRDGLGAHIHYDEDFVPVQADFNALPFDRGQFQLAIFNASFHYAVNFERALNEVKRVLQDDGQVVILDSPLYHDESSGQAMLREQQESFLRLYGCRSNALPSQGFLTYQRLEELARAMGIKWRMAWPNYGLSWALRPWKARVLGKREPARFALIIGRKE